MTVPPESAMGITASSLLARSAAARGARRARARSGSRRRRCSRAEPSTPVTGAGRTCAGSDSTARPVHDRRRRRRGPRRAARGERQHDGVPALHQRRAHRRPQTAVPGMGRAQPVHQRIAGEAPVPSPRDRPDQARPRRVGMAELGLDHKHARPRGEAGAGPDPGRCRTARPAGAAARRASPSPADRPRRRAASRTACRRGARARAREPAPAASGTRTCRPPAPGVGTGRRARHCSCGRALAPWGGRATAAARS
jgi:hypothetical protein